MNKILKILSILVIGFVMFSCSTPTNDLVEETPEETTCSITFVAEKEPIWDKPVAELLNSLSAYKNLKEGTEKKLPTIVYAINGGEEYVIEEPKSPISYNQCIVHYENNITSVVVGNENIKIKFWTTPAE